MSETLRTCATCKFHHTYGKWIDCRINPPIASPEDSVAWWPVVKPDDWCSKWEGEP